MRSTDKPHSSHSRRLRIGGLSLLATTGLLGTYLGYPGLRRAYAAVNCGSIHDEDSLRFEIGRLNLGRCDTLNIPAIDIILNNDLPQVTRSGSFTINGSTSGSTTIAGQDSHSAFYFKNATTVTVTNLTVLDTYSETHAAGLFAGGNVTLTGVTFTNNESDDGEGGAVAAGESIVIDDSTFTSNSAGDRGGAVSAFRSATVTNSTFTLNTSADDGGAIFAGAESTITNSIFENNRATNEGGALFLDGSSTVTGTRFTSNRAGTTDFGGAIYSDGTNLTVSNSSFTTNSAVKGGGIYAKYNATISGSTFSTNDATQIGGAVYVKASAAITDSGFTGNDAGQGGGALRTYRSATVAESSFTRNTATLRGGAVFAGFPVNVTDSTFTNNYSTSGGAVDSQTTVTVQSSTFSSNLAVLRGGAIYSILDQEISYSTFEANTARSGGGALSNSPSGGPPSTLGVINSTFYQNQAPLFGAIFWNGDVAIDFSTIAGNEFQATSSALGVTNSLTLSNSILYGNVDQTYPVAVDFVATGPVTASHNLFTSGSSFAAPPESTFTNTLYGDPLLGTLTNNGGLTKTMLPAADSPVIGMANPTSAPASDQRGFTRTTNGYADMGSVERGGTRPPPDPSQVPPAWLQSTTRPDQEAACPANMFPSWAQWPNDNTGGWTCEWTTWWDVNKGTQGGWVTTPGFNPGRPGDD